jgi:hypothetical protein
VPSGVLEATDDSPDPVVIGPCAPWEDGAVEGFGAACGDWFGAPRMTPSMTSNAAITAAAATTASVTLLDLLGQNRWLPAGDAPDFAPAPPGAPPLPIGDTPNAAACPAEPVEDK